MLRLAVYKLDLLGGELNLHPLSILEFRLWWCKTNFWYDISKSTKHTDTNSSASAVIQSLLFQKWTDMQVSSNCQKSEHPHQLYWSIWYSHAMPSSKRLPNHCGNNACNTGANYIVFTSQKREAFNVQLSIEEARYLFLVFSSLLKRSFIREEGIQWQDRILRAQVCLLTEVCFTTSLEGGCIQLGEDAIKWVYKYTPTGATCTVHKRKI